MQHRFAAVSEIQDLHKSCSVLVLNLKDRFGDYGLVGVAIFKQENESFSGVNNFRSRW